MCNMSRFTLLLAALAVVHAILASAQEFDSIHEITAGPENSPVICLLLHGATLDSSDWAPGSTTNTMQVLGDAGIRVVAIDLPNNGLSPELPASTDTRVRLVPFFVDKHRAAGQDQAAMLVAPSMSGDYAHPYIVSLTDETAGDLDAYVPVAPVAVDILTQGTISPAVLENLQVYAIYGENDATYLPDIPVIESLFPNFGSTIIPDAGHFAFQDDPDVFNELLIEVAQNITRSPLNPAASAPTASTTDASGEATDTAAADTSHAHGQKRTFGAVAIALVCIGMSVVFGSA